MDWARPAASSLGLIILDPEESFFNDADKFRFANRRLANTELLLICPLIPIFQVIFWPVKKEKGSLLI